MASDDYKIIEVSSLRVGMHVELDLGWMDHPFPTSSFKITSDKQIETLRKLGRPTVRISRSKSEGLDYPPTPAAPVAPNLDASRSGTLSVLPKNPLLTAQQQSLAQCERRFAQSLQQYRQLLTQVEQDPANCATLASSTVGGLVGDMIRDEESAIRLLSGTAGDRNIMHPVNVTIISLLLGKAVGLAQAELTDLGLAAMLHDVGKLQLPERVRTFDPKFAPSELRAYQDHVAHSVATGQRMGLSRGVLLSMAQHHEMADGSGFPSHAQGSSMSMGAKILSLVNRFDNLCNPVRLGAALTPHEALSSLFAQHKARFDPVVLSAFIRMMGVYPPGSVVQLIDDRHAMVVSVNSMRPLKPRVIVHDPQVPKHEALIVDLETTPQLAIRRSVKPSALPSAALDYLEPRSRICYYFESEDQGVEAEALA